MGGKSSRLEPLVPVQKVATDKLVGAWFVIAVMPTIFEKGAHNAVEKYSKISGKPGAVDIDFTFNQDKFDGALKSLPQKGSGWFDDTPGKWKVSPFWPVKMPYLVIDQSRDLADDKAWFVVGYPSRAYCWVLAREPELDDAVYAGIANRLVEQHKYPRGLPGMVKVPQSWVRDKSTAIGWR
eukprot:CAMPEP_0119276310 /NCGR_PEP_ID=MMETSP1329-20130426/15206_1 /TAXON_ID=114041 /ORGANISM="Genus nov. species nov., Strain RCC1024" /LENGTH=180 /DNA_ID=CAMNT_0007276739 /DNA_START=144 /DNA_END=683 /DNA_ORIENTATION=-